MPDAKTRTQEIAVYDEGDQTCSSGRLVVIRVVNTDHCTYIVHGTFASDSTWWKRSGRFAQAVETEHPGVWRCGNVEISEYSWTGANAHADRVAGGRTLARHIRQLEQRKQNQEVSYQAIDIIAHSHGGNVTLEALQQLSDANIPVNNVVLIATPHVKLEYQDPPNPWPWQDSEVWYDWLYFQESVFDAVGGTLHNIYSPEDAVQGYWADVRDGVSSSDVPDSDFFEELHVARKYTGPLSGHVVNIRQDTDVGSLDAHGVLHSTAMGTAIGHLLEGYSWSAARSHAGVPSTITNDDDMGG